MRYLIALSVLFFVGCASTCGTRSSTSGSGFNDYSYTAADGSTKIHRFYKDGNEEWITQPASTEAAAK